MPLGPGRHNSNSTCGTKVGICQRINLYIVSNLGNTHVPAVFEKPYHIQLGFVLLYLAHLAHFPLPRVQLMLDLTVSPYSSRQFTPSP